MKVDDYPSVTIVQPRLLYYRRELFLRLRQRLFEKNVILNLVHGQPSEEERLRKDVTTLEWSTPVRNFHFRLGQRPLLWQVLPRQALQSDLIVLVQENRILSNYPIFLARQLGLYRFKIALWGHGRNFQSKQQNRIVDKWKRAYSRNVDWWFAYTELTRRILVDDGFPREKITCLDNTVDVEKLRFLYEDVSESKVRAIRDQLGIEEGSHVGIYCGSIYAEKMIDFMMRSCELVRAADDTFHLIVIGDGPGTEEMMRRWNHLAWFHWVGAKQNPQKVEYFRIADIMINPGLVGLHILDSFAFGVPLISTSWALHSPEIAYVEEGSNAILVKGNERDYAQTVVDLFRSPERLAELKTCAAKSCTERGLDGMVERFSAGILSAMRA